MDALQATLLGNQMRGFTIDNANDRQKKQAQTYDQLLRGAQEVGQIQYRQGLIKERDLHNQLALKNQADKEAQQQLGNEAAADYTSILTQAQTMQDANGNIVPVTPELRQSRLQQIGTEYLNDPKVHPFKKSLVSGHLIPLMNVPQGPLSGMAPGQPTPAVLQPLAPNAVNAPSSNMPQISAPLASGTPQTDGLLQNLPATATNKDVPQEQFIQNLPAGNSLSQGNRDAYVRALLGANKDKDFVQRILNPVGQPEIDNGDGTYSTHKMASIDNIVFPMISTDPTTGNLIDFTDGVDMNDQEQRRAAMDKAYNVAVQNKDILEAPSPEIADYIATGGYKTATGFGQQKPLQNFVGTATKQTVQNIQNGKETPPNEVPTGVQASRGAQESDQQKLIEAQEWTTEDAAKANAEGLKLEAQGMTSASPAVLNPEGRPAIVTGPNGQVAIAPGQMVPGKAEEYQKGMIKQRGVLENAEIFSSLQNLYKDVLSPQEVASMAKANIVANGGKLNLKEFDDHVEKIISLREKAKGGGGAAPKVTAEERQAIASNEEAVNNGVKLWDTLNKVDDPGLTMRVLAGKGMQDPTGFFDSILTNVARATASDDAQELTRAINSFKAPLMFARGGKALTINEIKLLDQMPSTASVDDSKKYFKNMLPAVVSGMYFRFKEYEKDPTMGPLIKKQVKKINDLNNEMGGKKVDFEKLDERYFNTVPESKETKNVTQAKSEDAQAFVQWLGTKGISPTDAFSKPSNERIQLHDQFLAETRK